MKRIRIIIYIIIHISTREHKIVYHKNARVHSSHTVQTLSCLQCVCKIKPNSIKAENTNFNWTQQAPFLLIDKQGYPPLWCHCWSHPHSCIGLQLLMKHHGPATGGMHGGHELRPHWKSASQRNRVGIHKLMSMTKANE